MAEISWLLNFQVQTLSTWYEFDYWTEMATGVYGSGSYYLMLVFLVGFIVSQLFIAVVCFGFENLEEQLSEPTFSDIIIGLPYIELETDPDDNLCKCLNQPVNPLKGAQKVELDRGTQDGIRVSISFMYHHYAPAPLNAQGQFEVTQDSVSCSANPLHSLPRDECACLVDPIPVRVPTLQRPGSFSCGGGDAPDSKVAQEHTRNWSLGVGSGNGIAAETGDEAYREYRKLMGQWKEEAQQQLDYAANLPFQMAHQTEEPIELVFRYDSLVTWSNERVFSLRTMLRAQEDIDENNVFQFFHDNKGEPGKEMENELLADLIKIENHIDIPELVVHVKSNIKVVVEPFSNPKCDLPALSLTGSETVGQIKKMCLSNMKSENIVSSSIELGDCRIYLGPNQVNDECSLYEACLMMFDTKFDPMKHEILFSFTVDACEAFILTSEFDLFIMAVICVNTLFMSVEHYDSSDSFNNVLVMAEWMFNGIFSCEMFVKIYAYKGIGAYLHAGTNQFDCFIVFSSWINGFVEATGLNFTFIRVFRIIRAFRVTRVVRKLESVKVLIDAAFNSMQPIVNIMMFMMVVLIVYSCMGMQLYGGQFNFDDEIPRENFDNFVMAFLGLFQVTAAMSVSF